MSDTRRNNGNGKKTHDGKISSPACRIVKTDGEKMFPEFWDTDDPQSFHPKHKRDVKRLAHKKFRRKAKELLSIEEEENEL